MHLLSISNELQRNIAASVNSGGTITSIDARSQHDAGRMPPTRQNVMGKGRRIVPPGVREKIQTALHSGNVSQLQELMIDGHGHELAGRTSFVEDARRFLKTVPQAMETIRELQESVINGDRTTVERILAEQPLYARARDSNSFTLMHLAVVGGHLSLVNYFAEHFSSMINLKDNVSY